MILAGSSVSCHFSSSGTPSLGYLDGIVGLTDRDVVRDFVGMRVSGTLTPLFLILMDH